MAAVKGKNVAIVRRPYWFSGKGKACCVLISFYKTCPRKQRRVAPSGEGLQRIPR